MDQKPANTQFYGHWQRSPRVVDSLEPFWVKWRSSLFLERPQCPGGALIRSASPAVTRGLGGHVFTLSWRWAGLIYNEPTAHESQRNEEPSWACRMKPGTCYRAVNPEGPDYEYLNMLFCVSLRTEPHCTNVKLEHCSSKKYSVSSKGSNS